ncbi:helix-turn-helix domain-containing protein [Salimicrobium album]|uniref:DNA binding domain-containing protein, excisionase family n=1 Tax=Salimicrobium album TaxID=50717 RepID=A0A1H3D4W6_9BACI|nr:helix-turn-helix domain-containing protein [Salimicrobium album]SDX61552.1 DNA binding domain-containing protein, excisionase family [Salimicrobium album]
MERVTMTAQETAEYLGVCTETIYIMCRRKELPYLKIGRRIFFKKDMIDEWMMKQSTNQLVDDQVI